LNETKRNIESASRLLKSQRRVENYGMKSSNFGSDLDVSRRKTSVEKKEKKDL